MVKKNSGPSLAVRAIILNNEKRILLLKRASSDEYGNLWCLPGGKIDFGQTAEEAIAKEVKEETSLICSSVKFLFYQDNLPTRQGEKHYLTLYFKCSVNGHIKLNHESSNFVWVDQSDLNKYAIAFRNDEAIRRYWNEQNKLL